MSSTTEFRARTACRKSTEKGKVSHDDSSLPGPARKGAASAAAGAEYFALAAQATNDALRDWDVKSGALSWPCGLENLLGHRETAATRSIGFWERHLHPEDRAAVLDSLRETLASQSECWCADYRFRRADGSYLCLLERARIFRDENGNALRLVGSLMDMTARKHLQDQLLRSQKMEAFGQLAGSVAHDFNNFLTTILGYSDLLLGEQAVKGTVAKQLREIQSAAGRASNLTAQLLALSRKQPLHLRVLEANELLTDLEQPLRQLLGPEISLQRQLHAFGDGGFIRADPGQMKQVILKLAANAREAMPTGGRFSLTTSSLAVPEFETELPDAIAPGNYLTISLIDEGTGMSERVQDHLFEPFFTTKETSRASGLGLATSYGIIRQSGGYIQVESKLGHGTTVTILMPRVPAPARLSARNKETLCGTETILFLEEDKSVRQASARLLRELGYHVLEAAGAREVAQFIGKISAQPIHLLVTDIFHPRIGGRHFADSLSEASPSTKVIYLSGYLDASAQLESVGSRMTSFLPRPFQPLQLAGAIREALDAPL